MRRGRCRCRCPPASAARRTTSISWRCRIASSDPAMLLYPDELESICGAATARCNVPGPHLAGLRRCGPGQRSSASHPDPDAISYLQYSSGSTRFPHGVAVTHRALLADGGPRAWNGLPAGRPRDQLATVVSRHGPGRLLPLADRQSGLGRLPAHRSFARRPLAWLDPISRNPGTSLSYSPTFGYDICARRISSQSSVAERFDLSRWRVAGNGAGIDPARRDAKLRQRLCRCRVQGRRLHAQLWPRRGNPCRNGDAAGKASASSWSRKNAFRAPPAISLRPARYRAIVNCGVPVRGMQVEVRGERGQPSPTTTSARCGAGAHR